MRMGSQCWGGNCPSQTRHHFFKVTGLVQALHRGVIYERAQTARLTLIGAIGGEEVRLLEGAKMDLGAGLAFPVEADGLHLYDVVRLLLKVPEDTGAAGGVDFPDESIPASIFYDPRSSDQ
ncbi:hypothetical protein EYF80_007111 [Liparis tanakae]|uniref:Uncharacterized protein n=1 Tax=Liparis tanakae TaxID=230148 RepID=A0A4Z2IZG4_9TELE|nr:hypothetical protein EYF80_007111 [Liparis tanakae]